MSDLFITKAMQAACVEARKWLGATAPNPAVGAVALDANGVTLAVAAHQRDGEAHAEALLLEICRNQGLLDKVHTICVTLEPCNHQGRTPPCTEALIKAGIRRVVIGARDPNPEVKGGGINRLRQAGIEVVTGIAEDECMQLIHAFAYTMNEHLPWVTVKRAFDYNGSMIPPTGQKTFTSEESVRLSHRMRKKAGAILTGSGTVLADAPLYTVRYVPDHPGKRRWLAILDRRDRIPTTDYLNAAHKRGLDPVIYKSIQQALNDLKAKGVQDVLVEAGPSLSDAILATDYWTMALDIRQTTDGDKVSVRFNDRVKIPFDKSRFDLSYILPE